MGFDLLLALPAATSPGHGSPGEALRTHMWWLAHTIFAGGFFFLSYWVVLAFHSTRAFSWVFSQEEIMEQLRRPRWMPNAPWRSWRQATGGWSAWPAPIS
ncbi:hypothetical protein [Azovibrio restrictus]|uniref:hypothetical protein n=1 Tax=Azovibrio restrictus TaxID=146938 RepID=UPI0026EF17B3|nr:hypothetical protein [Azovibrio restrictus]